MSVDTWVDHRNRWRDHEGVVHVVGTYGNTCVYTDCGFILVESYRGAHTRNVDGLFERSSDVVTCLRCWYDPLEYKCDEDVPY